MTLKLNGLYAITDEILTPHETIISQVTRAIKAGVKIIQYRNKTDCDQKVKNICVKLQEICTQHNVIFILDDRLNLAIEINTDGIHIGQDDISLIEARRRFHGIIGVSCYGDISRALDAQIHGANYVAFGSFFRSFTKPNAKIVPMNILKQAQEVVKIPICVIGGINANNIIKFRNYDIDMISIVSALFEDDNIENNVAKLLNQM